jgi:choline dehydrogenase-like flavoprotein
MIPNEQCYCEIDPQVVDRWGIPVLRFHWAWSDHELKQVVHMQETFRAIIEGMGGRVNATPAAQGRGRAAGPAGSGAPGAPQSATAAPQPPRPPISRGGAIIHEVGTIRMGNDPQTSVLNRFCQAHAVKNLFVADAGPFVGNPDKNPTHTIIALAWRTAEYLAEEMRKGNV